MGFGFTMKRNTLTTVQIGQKLRTAAQLIDQTRNVGVDHRIVDRRYAADFRPLCSTGGALVNPDVVGI